jgi:hypothetical protein
MTTSDRYPTEAAGHDSRSLSDPATRHDAGHEYPEAGSTDRQARDQDTGSHLGESRTATTATRTSTSSAGFPDGDSARATDSTSRDGRADGGGSNKLFSPARAEEYSSRWTAVKGEFVDEPRRAVAQADELVGELLEELHESFGRQRHSLDHGLDNDETSTEDLRMALGRYRDFFNRLLSV